MSENIRFLSLHLFDNAHEKVDEFAPTPVPTRSDGIDLKQTFQYQRYKTDVRITIIFPLFLIMDKEVKITDNPQRYYPS